MTTTPLETQAAITAPLDRFGGVSIPDRLKFLAFEAVILLFVIDAPQFAQKEYASSTAAPQFLQ